MSNEELTQRAEAFKKSIATGKLTAEKVSNVIAGWLNANMLTFGEHDTLKDMIFGKPDGVMSFGSK